MPEHRVFGLGCTAAIATNRHRKGTDRCHIAVQSENRTACIDLTFDKSLTREEQEAKCRNAIINLMAEESGIKTGQEEKLSTMAHNATEDWQNLFMDRVAITGTDSTGTDSDVTALLPGAFNPLHEGHLQMLTRAGELLQDQVTLEISIRNVDKPTLDYLTMQERLEQAAGLPLVFTNAPTFEAKARLFPGATFIVGIDTLTRIQDERYYNSHAARDRALQLLQERGNRFLVFGRKVNDVFQTLDDVELLPGLTALCTGVNENEFRLDISSTELRNV